MIKMAVFPSDCGEPMVNFIKLWDQGHCGTKRGFRKLDGACQDGLFWLPVWKKVENGKPVLFYCQPDHAGKQCTGFLLLWKNLVQRSMEKSATE